MFIHAVTNLVAFLGSLVAFLASAAAIPTWAAAQDRPLPLVLVNDSTGPGAVERALQAVHVQGFHAQLVTAPTAGESITDTRVEDAISRARNLYVNEGDFAGCLTQLPDALVDAALGRADALGASRVLLWRTACAVAAGDTARAADAAAQFASMGLARPPDIEAVSPEVDQRLSEAGEATRARAQFELAVTSTAREARVTVDAQHHRTLPAILRLTPGAHVLRLQASGRVPEVRRVMLTSDQSVGFDPEPSPPELAASQWAERFGTGPGALSLTSVSLMARALSTPRVVLIEAEETQDGIALRAVLGVQRRSGQTRGRVVIGARARFTLHNEGSSDASDLLRDLLIGAHLLESAPPLRRRPLFWAAVGVAVAGSVSLGVLLARNPRHTTDIVIQ